MTVIEHPLHIEGSAPPIQPGIFDAEVGHEVHADTPYDWALEQEIRDDHPDVEKILRYMGQMPIQAREHRLAEIEQALLNGDSVDTQVFSNLLGR